MIYPLVTYGVANEIVAANIIIFIIAPDCPDYLLGLFFEHKNNLPVKFHSIYSSGGQLF